MAAAIGWFYLMWLFVSCFIKCFCDKNKYFHMSSLCGRKQLYKKVDGAVLMSDNEDSVDCVVTFQTDTILQRFMLRFDELQLDCNDHLIIYDGAHAYGPYKADLSCNHNKIKVGPILTTTNYVTLQYKTDGWGQIGNGFKLVLTAYKETAPGIECRDFRCSNKMCIDKDLRCDGVNHCGDQSDETSEAFCYDETGGPMMGMEGLVFVALAVTLIVLFFVCMVVVGFIVCRRLRHRPGGGMNAYPPRHNDAIREAPSIPGKLSGKLVSPCDRDRLQCHTGDALLSNQMSTENSRSQINSTTPSRGEKGEWLV